MNNPKYSMGFVAKVIENSEPATPQAITPVIANPIAIQLYTLSRNFRVISEVNEASTA
jgi:hypothetical protein